MIRKKSSFASLLLGLSAAFNTSASVLSQQQPSYWRVPGYDAIFEVQRCENNGLCAKLHYVNPEDEVIRDLFLQLMDKASPRSRRAPPREIDNEDILSFCGFSPAVRVRQTEENFWYGSFKTLVTDKTYTLRISERSEDRVRMRVHIPYIRFFGVNISIERVHTPSDPCVATRSMPDILRLVP